MAYQLPDKLKSLTPYDPVTESYRVAVNANESFLDLPDALREEVLAAIREVPFNRYPDPACRKLRELAAAYFGVKPENLAAGNGSDELIGLIVNSFLQPGDTLAVAMPDFSMYAFYAQLAGIGVLDVTKASGREGDAALSVAADDVIRAVREAGAKMFIFSNPCNPTSLLLDKAGVQRIIRELPDVLVVADEAYMEFADDASVLAEAVESDHVIVLKTCSKAFGCAGIRLGFAAAGERLAGLINTVRSPYNVNSLTQAAGCVLFSHPEWLAEAKRRIVASREALYAGLSELAARVPGVEIPYPPQTNFVFFRVPDAGAVYRALLAEGIAVRHMGDFLRVSAGSVEENRAVIAALEAILAG